MKYVIKNCDNYTNFDEDWTCRSTIQNREGCYCCKNITDCLMKRIVEKCREAHGQIIGYEKGKIYDGKNLIEANLPLATINPLAEEILDLLGIEECE